MSIAPVAQLHNSRSAMSRLVRRSRVSCSSTVLSIFISWR